MLSTHLLRGATEEEPLVCESFVERLYSKLFSLTVQTVPGCLTVVLPIPTHNEKGGIECLSMALVSMIHNLIVN